MKTIKLLIVANNCPWESWPDKIQEIKNFFAPSVNLLVDFSFTKYQDIPFVPFSTQLTNAPVGSTLLYVEPKWYDDMVTAIASNHDVVLFVVNMNQWPSIAKTPVRGVRTDKDQGPVELQIGADENDGVYKNGVLLYKSFQHFAEHEIMHALFMLSGQNDPTHHWDYEVNNLAGALNELSFPAEKTPVPPTLIQKIISPLTKPPMDNPLLNKMCAAIQNKEGYWAPGENLKYPNGTPAYRNCNPGNLRYAGQIGSIGQKNGFAVFPTYQAGLDALKRQILLVARNQSRTFPKDCTLQMFFNTYAPVKDNNDPILYCAQVATAMGVTPDWKLSTLVK